MAFKLTKDEQKDKDTHTADLRGDWGKVEDAKSLAESVIQRALDDLKQAVETFKATAERAEAFRDEVATRLREEFDDKSETWQEGEKGQEASAFVESWESASCEVDDMEVPELDLDLNGDGNDTVTALEDLAGEP